MSYTVPTDAEVARIEGTGGDDAAGFTDEAAVRVPDPPSISSVESAAGGLTVSWATVTGISGYDVEWRQDGESTWESARTGIRQQYTIGDLTDGALYWVRVRAVKTHGGLDGQTLYTTSWSASAPAVVGDWAPQNLTVTPGDQSSKVSWDNVAVATGFDVEYWPEGESSEPKEAGAVRDGRGWAAYIVGLDNGETYDVRVRSVRALNPEATLPPSYDRRLVSGWAAGEATPGIGFRVAVDDRPLFMRGGGVVERELRLVYDGGDSMGSGTQQRRPFASRSMGAWILTGPSAGQTVQCRVSAAPEQIVASVAATGDAPRGPCVTDDEGRMTLVYTSVLPASDSVGNTDHVRVYVDPNKNQQRDPGESFGDLDPAVAIVRPINYGALGDSYSAGENGEPTDQRLDPFEGSYLDAECHRWTLAYPFLLAGSANFASIGFYACTGAVTSDVYVPAGSGVFNGQSSSLNTLDKGLQTGSQQNIDMVTMTIGGNDLGFGDGINDCFESTCSLDSLKISIDQFKIELRKVISGLKTAAPHATVFVLGYPHLVPVPSDGFCQDLTLEFVVKAVLDGFPDGDISPGKLGLGILDLFGAKRGISKNERAFLQEIVDDLNAAISDVAAEKGVHFVAVSDEFRGHEPCGEAEDGAWLNGVVAERVDASVVDSPNAIPLSDRSFHPNAAGHREYARILREYIEGAVGGAHGVNRAGLPNNPPPVAAQQDAAGSSGAGAARSSVDGSRRATGSDAAAAAGSGTGFLWARRAVAAASACAAPLAPGDRVELFAAGFAADSAVTFTVVGVSVPVAGATSVVALSPAPTIPAATTDASGRLEVTWTIPAAPEVTVDPAPRAYVVKASGTDGSGAVLAVRSVLPLVVYPGTAPCAVDDVAQTSLGRAGRIAVLGNDVAPAGGSLDGSSVVVEAVGGGSFAVNTSDGSLTFTPDAGFAGTVRTRYRVYDGWDIGVSAAVTVTVDAGCTITGVVGATVIEGTDGDDVICVADPDDWDAFHVIDAKGGDDVILGGDGVDWIYGGAGADTVYGRGGRDRIDGGAGADTIHGGDGFDTVHSADLVDRIVDDAGGYELLLALPAGSAHVAPVVSDDVAHVAAGETVDVDVLGNDYDPNENLVAASLSISQAPTAGTAVVVATSPAEVAIRYTAGDADGTYTLTYQVCDTLDACATGEVTVTVGTAGCTIVGTLGDDSLRGTPGDDVICGLAGDDVIHGGGGNDVIVGGAGDDLLSGGQGDDVIWGGAGDDGLSGGRGDDVVLGGAGDDVVYGDDGNDVLWGGAGDDYLGGGPDDDALHGGAGNDTLWSDAGDDTLWGGAGNDSLHGNPGADVLYGGSGDDTLRGNTQNDVLWGGAGVDRLFGGGHDDRLVGGAGNDALQGDGGDDRLWGNSGDDRLDGGGGSDYTNGGDGTDTCRRGMTTARCEA